MDIKTNEKTYSVYRDGVRVSEDVYSSPTDQSVLDELNFWKRIVEKNKDKQKVEIKLN